MKRISILLLLGIFLIAVGVFHWKKTPKTAPPVIAAPDEGDPDALESTRFTVVAISVGAILIASSAHLFRVARWREKSVVRHQAEKENWLHQHQDLSKEDQSQVNRDMQALDALQKENDDESIARRIDHWAYFPSPIAAQQYCDWARCAGYTVLSNQPKEGTHCVSLSHVGTVRLPDIIAHTLPLHRQAAASGGTYDGWETVVCKALI